MDGKPSESAIFPVFRVLREQAMGIRWPAAFVVLSLAAYSLYVTQHFRQTEEESQRELGHAALVLESTVDKALENVENLDAKPGFLCQFALEQPFLELLGPCKDLAVPDTKVKATLVASRKGLQIVRGSELRFRFRVNTLLQELSFLESFNTLALLNQDGAVLFTSDGQQPVRLRQLRLAERTFREPAFGDDPPLILVDLKSALSSGAVKPGFEEARASASRLRAELAGTSYQVYIQPLRFQEDDKRQLLLVALRPTIEVLRQSLAFDTYFLAFLLLVIVGLCLGYPFLKLWALNHRERFRVRDLLFLYLSTGALLSLGATVTFAVDGYFRYQSIAAAILPALHKQLQADLMGELRAARRQLVAYDNCPASLSIPAEPVQVEQVAWVDGSGKQLFKLTPTGEPAALVSVAHRTYFRSIVSNGLWAFRSPTADSEPPFFFGPSRSITDGQFYSFLSIPSGAKSCRGKQDASPSVATVLTFSLHSLAQRPLPATFGFALFNREGTVLYHSDDRLSLRQNLISETDDPARLRSVILAEGEATLDLPYRGRPHRFLIRPLTSLETAPDHVADGHILPHRQSSPSLETAPNNISGILYLAVFQDMSIVRYIATHAFLSSMLWPQTVLALWMAISIAAACLASRWRTPDANWRQWLWTQPRRVFQYRQSVIILFVLVALAFVLQVSGVTYALTLLLPVAAPLVALFLVVLAPPSARASAAQAPAVLWHRLLILLLGVSMSMMPASALYQIIWGYELGKLIHLEQHQSAAMAQDLPAQTRLRLLLEKAQPAWVDKGRSVREKYITTGISVRTKGDVTHPGPQWIYDWQDRASWVLPMRNDTAISLRGLSAEPFIPAGARWGPIPRAAPAVIVILLLVWLLYLWTGWNSRHILLSGRQTAGVPLATLAAVESAWAALSLDEQCLLAQIASERIGNPHQSDMVVSLVRSGWLMLAPEIRPASPLIQAFLLAQAQQSCQNFEQAKDIPRSEHSWRAVRKSLLLGVGIAVLFLFSTQPALPVDFLGLLSIVTGALGGAVKSMDRLSNWFSPPAKSPPPS